MALALMCYLRAVSSIPVSKRTMRQILFPHLFIIISIEVIPNRVTMPKLWLYPQIFFSTYKTTSFPKAGVSRVRATAAKNSRQRVISARGDFIKYKVPKLDSLYKLISYSSLDE